MEKARVSALGMFLLWAFFLFLACFVYGDWWPMFNIFFLVIGFIPFVFGSHQSHGLWGAMGDFVAGAIGISLFAFPMVLHNAYAIGPQALALACVSNFFLFGGLYIATNHVTFD